jgi:predicted amidohydrolase
MNEKKLAAIALSNRDYPSFDAKLDEAATWINAAADQGVDLAVLPEALNQFKGDGEGNTKSLPLDEIALDDWQTACARLLEIAARRKMALAVPLITREGSALFNSFFLVGRDGSVRGRYRKMRLTASERKNGIQPGQNSPIDWEGLKIGGAICFDCYFPEVFQQQASAGANLFLIPSLTPAGGYLNFYALHHSVPLVLAYPAWSRIIDVNGGELAAGGYRNETLRFGFGSPVITATINFDRAVFYADLNQAKMNDLQRAYGSRIRIQFDQPNVLFIVESRDPNLSMSAVIREFGLITRQDYFRRFRVCPGIFH